MFAISSALVDTDTSESLTLRIDNLPAGATLTDGGNTFTATSGNTAVDVTNWTLTNLTLTPPADSHQDFVLTVTATATEGENGEEASRIDNINVEVAAVADQPSLTVPATVSLLEDATSAPLPISANASNKLS